MGTKLGNPLVHCNKEETCIKGPIYTEVLYINKSIYRAGGRGDFKKRMRDSNSRDRVQRNYGLYKTVE